jgi:hypothetical protein
MESQSSCAAHHFRALDAEIKHMGNRQDLKGSREEWRLARRLGFGWRGHLRGELKKLRRSIRRRVKRDLSAGREVDALRSVHWIL